MFVFLRLQFFQAQIQVFTLGKNFINIIFNDSLCSACFTNTNFASVVFQLCVPIYHVNFIGKIYLKFSFIQLTQLSSMCTLFFSPSNEVFNSMILLPGFFILPISLSISVSQLLFHLILLFCLVIEHYYLP